MADISDVLNTLSSMLVSAYYPNGTSQPSTTGLPVLVYPGWPLPAQLDTDMRALNAGSGGRVHVTLFPRPGRNTTRWMRAPMIQTANTPTLTATVRNGQVTIGGTVSTPQNVAIKVNGAAYLYAVQSGDTTASIAQALAAKISGATASGNVVSLPATAIYVTAAVGASGSASQPVRNTERVIQMTVWANSPSNRDVCSKALDNALAGVEFIDLPDGTAGRLIYVDSPYLDTPEKASVYRRDVLYSVDFLTVQTFSATEVVAAGMQFGVQMPNGSVQNEITTYQ